MAAPAFGSIGTYLQGTATTADFAAPASVASGDVIVIVFYLDASTTVSGLPSGFAHAPGSPLRVGAGLGGEHSLNVIAKRATGADAGPYTVTFSASQYRNGAAIRYTGCVASGTFWDANSGTGTAIATDTSNNTVTPAVSMTTSGADEMLVFAATNWSGGTWTPPTSFTERIDNGDKTLTADDLVQAAAGTTGSVTATCVGSNKRAAWLGALIGTTSSGTTHNADSTVSTTATLTSTAVKTAEATSAASTTAALTSTAVRTAVTASTTSTTAALTSTAVKTAEATTSAQTTAALAALGAVVASRTAALTTTANLTASATVSGQAIRATSTSTVTAGRASTATLTAGRTSIAAVSAKRTSNGGVT